MITRFSIQNKYPTAEIDIEGIIGEGWFEEGITAKDIKAQLKAIAEIKANTIIVNINSLGGDLFTAIAIHDLLKENPAQIIVNIHGMTASAATVIAMAGDTIRMSDNALLLVHRASSIMVGNKNDFEMILDDLENYDNLIADIYAKRTGQTREFHLEQMDVNNGQGEWLTPEEAKAAGYVDEIFEPEHRRIAASVNDILNAKLPIPKKIKEDEMEDVKNMIQGLKDWIVETFGAKPEAEAYKQKALAIENRLAEMAVNIKEAENKATEADQRVATTTAERDDVTAERDQLKERVTALEAELSQLKAGPAGVTNEKDPDIGGVKKKEHPFDNAAKEMKVTMSHII